jgi:hypothetical protein
MVPLLPDAGAPLPPRAGASDPDDGSELQAATSKPQASRERKRIDMWVTARAG